MVDFEHVYHPSWPLCVTQVLEDVGTKYHPADSRGLAAPALGQLKEKHCVSNFRFKTVIFLMTRT